MRTTLLFTIMSMIPALAFAQCTVRSGPNTAALIELYTSQGCDSTPPAERWLSKFVGAPGAGSLVIPIAFHVDYWDYLGWKDRYGDARFSDRQRQIARAAGTGSVYTPQVVVGGRDFPAWRGGAAAQALESVNLKPARATIELTTRGPSVEATAWLAGGERGGSLALVIAITQNGIATHVTAGENRGETLRHDFVVRDYRTARFDGQRVSTQVEFAPRADWILDRMSVVAFVQDTRTGEVLQALSTPVCR
jgi:hypothetical protein